MRFILLSCLLVLSCCYYIAPMYVAGSKLERHPTSTSTSSLLDTFELINEAVTDAELDTTNMMMDQEHQQHQLMKQKSLLQMQKPAAKKKKDKKKKKPSSVTKVLKKLKAMKDAKKQRLKEEAKKLLTGIGRGGHCLKNKHILSQETFARYKSYTSYSEEVAFQLKKYSDIAYCPYQAIKSWTCSSCKEEAQTGFKVLGQPYGAKSELSSFVGLAPLDDEKKAIIIAFRGTNMKSIKNWSVNLAFGKKSAAAVGASGKVHGGFLKGYGQMETELLKALKLARSQCRKCKVYITGHSLGGALATIAAAKLVGKGHLSSSRVVLYTFGSPRVGDAKFATWFTKSIPQSFRVTHGYDIVPTVPPASFGFKHVSREVYYPHLNRDFYICEHAAAAEDKQCHRRNGKLKSIIKGAKYLVTDHLIYVGDPILCNQLPPAASTATASTAAATKSFLEMHPVEVHQVELEQAEMQEAALQLYQVLGGTIQD